MQNFRKKYFSNVGNGAIKYVTLICARVQELVIGAWRTESLIGNGIPGGKLDKKRCLTFVR